MPRQSGNVVENNFIKGLVTETSALKSDPSSCRETFDCIFDFTGKISRRPGIDFESGFTKKNVTIETDEVFTEFLWTSVGGSGQTSFVVVQQGSTLRFYDVSDDTVVSSHLKTFTIDLNDFVPGTGIRNPALFRCDYAQGDGKLIVVNEACDPFYIVYDTTGDTITGTAITLKFRDFKGLNDGLTVSQRPTETVASLKTNNPPHYYNLINQGWYTADALAQWDAARTDLPSNADRVAIYRKDETDAFEALHVTANDPGNTPAPKGHFILAVGVEDRGGALTDGGFTGVTLPSSTPLIGQGLGTIFSDPSLVSASLAFDTFTNFSTSFCATQTGTSTYVGKNYISVGGKQVHHAKTYGSNNAGYDVSGNHSTTVTLYAKNGSAPANGTDGTNLGSITFTDTADEHISRTINSSDALTVWDYVWLQYSIPGATGNIAIAEVEFYSGDPTATFARPTSIAFFAGRAWYAGIKSSDGSNLYFTQIIETNDQLEKCYQLNDPTSEFTADLLPTDGGVIKIPELSTVVKLFAMQAGLLVFATNGVWLIGGSTGAAFQANDFVITRLTTVGTNSPMSITGVAGVPYFWTDTDIFTVEYDSSYGTYAVKPVTTTTISTFLTNIPIGNHAFVKGAYSRGELWAYWLYNADSNPTDDFTYTNVLILNTITGAWYPWTIGDADPKVRGLLAVTTPTLSVDPVVKFVTTIPTNATHEDITFSEFRRTDFKDWTDAGFTTDYLSYAISGYRLDGQTNKKFQSNYVTMFFDNQDNASCFIQGRWDFTNSGSSGRWSTTQQVYRQDSFRDVQHSRRKIRGSGPALQLKFSSESGKPFTLLGWSIWETSNVGV